LESRFGDGYSQRLPDGINNTLLMLDLSFRGRSQSEILEISEFLSAHRGAYSFQFAVPAPFDLSPNLITDEYNNSLFMGATTSWTGGSGLQPTGSYRATNSSAAELTAANLRDSSFIAGETLAVSFLVVAESTTSNFYVQIDGTTRATYSGTIIANARYSVDLVMSTETITKIGILPVNATSMDFGIVRVQQKASTRNFICKKWSSSWRDSTLLDLTAQFEEVVI
jgi:phage-related protein